MNSDFWIDIAFFLAIAIGPIAFLMKCFRGGYRLRPTALNMTYFVIWMVGNMLITIGFIFFVPADWGRFYDLSIAANFSWVLSVLEMMPRQCTECPPDENVTEK